MTEAAAAAPVFLQSWWRTSSTYVWSRLRRNPALCCYSEPLHEMVGGLIPIMTHGTVDDVAVQRLHHPPMQRPYFAEYEPLVRAGTVGFSKALSYDRFLLYPDEPDEELLGYLSGLAASARERGRRPLFACVRGSLRAAWMRRRFGGVHLALLRNPRDQWGSMLEQQAQGGAYFTAGVIAVAAKLAARFPRAFAHVPVKLVNYRGPNYNPSELGRYGAFARELDPALGYALFMPVWIASALQLVSVCDTVLDSDRISAEPAARAAAQEALAAHGLPVDFSDWATPRHPELALEPARLEAIEAEAVRALAGEARPLAVFSPARIRARAPELEPLSGRLLLQTLEALGAA